MGAGNPVTEFSRAVARRRLDTALQVCATLASAASGRGPSDQKKWPDRVKRWAVWLRELDDARAAYEKAGGATDDYDREINILKAEWTINQQYYAVTPPAVPRSAVSARKIEIATDALHKHLTNDPKIIKRAASAWCKEKGFGLSTREFFSVWYTARARAGLDPSPKGGRPKPSH